MGHVRRGIPRSYRTMEGFGVHTFRLYNDDGASTLVKFHWKPALGIHSLVWEESQRLGGIDPDFHRRDPWNAIESGAFPEWELGVQVMEDNAEQTFEGIDLLDPTKLVPEELCPVRIVGRLTLDRNPTNFFAETEQIAFHTGHLVRGIDITDDPLLHARMVPAAAGPIDGRVIGILVGPDVKPAAVDRLAEALDAQDAVLHVIGPRGGKLANGRVEVHHTYHTCDSVMFDALVVDPSAAALLDSELKVAVMVQEAYRHHKAVAALGDGGEVLERAGVPDDGAGVVLAASATKAFAKGLIEAVGWHRHWDR